MTFHQPSHVRVVEGDVNAAEYHRSREEEAAFGRTGHMVWRTIQALHALIDAGHVRDAYNPRTGQFHRCYEATEQGRIHASGVHAFHPGGAS